MILHLLSCWALQESAAPDLDVIEVTRDDTVIDRSCRIVVKGPIADANGDGVLHVTRDGITIDFAGAHLRGAPDGILPDAYAGTGIRITGERVTLRGARVSGFRVGILATGSNGLVLEDADVSDNFRQRLLSTPEAEHGSDWLWPHANDGGEWLRNYGAGICVKDAEDVTVRRCRAREGQNGLILDRVDRSKVYDNDFSFLSGWGIALWRSSENVISRNAVDFCVRGYSHGIYNRGQDSAGILMFEQCSRNVVAENSGTHGGDGFFGFAGKEALGENVPEGGDFDCTRKGNNDNLIVRNDFSYAPAHGIEMTFSFGNRLVANRLVENAICGVWGGYSKDTWIHDNDFERNGDMAYGLERGGINIEHGARNRIEGNRFRENKCGVHLWWDEDKHLIDLPWARKNGHESADNTIAWNTFEKDIVGLHLRDSESTVVAGNTMTGLGKEVDATAGSEPVPMDLGRGENKVPEYPVFGDTRPVGARKELRGREHIVMTEWGPYDWETPLLFRAAASDAEHVFLLLGEAKLEGLRVGGEVAIVRHLDETPPRVVLVPKTKNTAVSYELKVRAGDQTLEASGVLLDTSWDVRFFAWKSDPRGNEEAWRIEAEEHVAQRFARLEFPFGGGGPSQLAGAGEALVAAALPTDRFGTLAEAEMELPPGRWRLETASDDGIRVWIDGDLRIDDWTHHATTNHAAEVEVAALRKVKVRIEHFELGGGAHLSARWRSMD